MNKTCKDCRIEKSTDDFFKSKSNKDGYYNDCKVCYEEKRKTYSKNYFMSDVTKERRKTYSKNHIMSDVTKEKRNNRRFKKYYENIELSREINRIARKKQRDKNRSEVNRKRRIYYMYKMKTDPLFKIKKNIRNRIWKYTKSIGKSKKTFDIVGITAENLKTYLENQFISNMTWENYGVWHIDHRIPLDSAKTEDEIYKLCHYTNLQPMWGIDNVKKGSKILVF
jgi:hypothetical protein